MTPGARRALAAASRLFYERGIHAVGVDLIAAEAGVTKKTLYDRFGSRSRSSWSTSPTGTNAGGRM